jgi:glycosyltransferase involved in cell wall biosynthesis
LARYVGTPVTIPPLIHGIGKIGPLHRYFRKHSGMDWYDGLLLELATYFHMRKHRNGVYHFLFPERDFRFLADRIPARNHRLAATFHATPQELLNIMRDTTHLKRLDGAIAVARNQIPLLESILGNGKVTFIPHGVDTSYYTPDTTKRLKPAQCICIGHHHRDLDLLCRIAERIKLDDPEVRIILVDRVFHVYRTPEDRKKYLSWFDAIGNVELRHQVSDADLLSLYRTSAATLLPLIDATANVALLEALSCGVPIVVNDVGGIRDYVDSTCAAVCDGTAEAMAREVLKFVHDATHRSAISDAARVMALTFDW